VGDGGVVVIGGTEGLGWGVAGHYAKVGRRVVISGRDPARAASRAAELGGDVTGIGFDLAEPATIGPAVADVPGPIDHLVLAALERDQNAVRDYDVAAAIRLVTLKLVGYTEVVHAMLDRLHDDSSILLFGGLAKDKPYPGSTTVTTVNHGVDGLVRTMSVELRPIRVNAIHPGIVGDSPYWSGKDQALAAVRQRALTGRYVAMSEIVDAAVMMLENTSIAATELRVDGGWHLPL
jgi:NAD(P)-dependent dehydrogenase (short-subunit alcohol dehydrogenase family)